MISVILPTYNERENIPRLLESLASVFSSMSNEVEIIVVDDNSPDGTAEIARRISESLPISVHIVVRQSDPDLSKSVVRGLREAQGDVLVVMDADFQHPPEIVPELANAVSPEVPVAVATRYTNGGGIDNWSLFRRTVSFGALLLSKLFIPAARGISDPISGFFAVHAGAVEPNNIYPQGYKILLEILAQINPREVAEVGFLFRERQIGDSSLDFEQYFRFLKHIIACGFRSRFSNEYNK